MSNTILTPTMITREALRILHQKLNFVGSVNRSYDDRFAQSGAKIGTSLQIRLPNQYSVRTGAAIDVQDTTEQQVTLTVSTQKGVDMQFSSQELTMSIDDFSSRILEPAMAVLAANIESDAMTMIKDVYNSVDNSGAAITFANVLNGRKKINDFLAPQDSNRMCLLDTTANVDLVDALKGLFHDSKEVAKQYRDGFIGRSAGFTFAENTILPSFSPGARSQTYQVNGSGTVTGSTLTVKTGTGAMVVGDVFTISGVNRVHPETKVDTGELMQFVVTAAYSGGAGDVSISPSIVTSGALQNVSAAPANNATLTFVGTASTAHHQALAYHRDAFAFATADLVMPKGVDFAAREVFDGISMRIVRAYDINNDNLPCRIDVLYGYKAIRPQLACRLAHN